MDLTTPERAQRAQLLHRTVWGQLALVVAWALVGALLGEPIALVIGVVAGVAAAAALALAILRAGRLIPAAIVHVSALAAVLVARLLSVDGIEPATWFLIGVVVVEAGLFVGARAAFATAAAAAGVGAALLVIRAGGALDAIDPDQAQRVVLGGLMFALLALLQRAAERLHQATLARAREAARRERALFDATPAGLLVVDLTPMHAWLVERDLLGRPDELRRLRDRDPAAIEAVLASILVRDVNPAAMAAGVGPASPARPLLRANQAAAFLVLERMAAGAREVRGEDDLVIGDRVRRTMIRAWLPADPAELTHVVIGLLDVTAERQLEEQIRAGQRLETVSRLAGGVAHDFNNLFTIVRMSGDRLARRAGDDAPSRRDVERLRDALARATARTRQLLLFSRREVARPVELEPHRVVAELEPQLRRSLDERITLTLELAADAGVARIDPAQLEQAVLNLAVNAQEAMAGGGSLRVSARRVVVAAGAVDVTGEAIASGEHVALAVIDTGEGMDAAARARAFEPFFTTRGGKAAGLGLSIVYGIARQAGGAVRLDSEPGRGTTVELLLPRVGDAAPARTAITTIGVGGAGAGAGERVLLVDDEDGVREVAQVALEEAGYRVLAVAGGAAALAAVERGDRIDLLVTDLAMPEMGGRELAERLRRHWPRLPVLFVSGHAPDGDPAAGLAAPAPGFLAKPFTGDQLVAAVRAVLPVVRREASAS